MGINTYLEAAPLYELTLYKGNVPQSAIPFVGSPRKHPYEKDKLILVQPKEKTAPLVLEFKYSDLINVENHASHVSDNGETIYLVRIWIRRGAQGTVHMPFEVGDKNFPLKL